MSEARFENVMRELRATAPPAPERLRNLVRTLPTAQPRIALRLRPALSIAIAIAIAVGLGAALIGGLSRTRPHQNVAYYSGQRANSGSRTAPAQGLLPANPRALEDRRAYKDSQAWKSVNPSFVNPVLAPGSRLQRYDVAMDLRVRDLSRSTQAAVHQTRRLGGYVAAADYGTDTSAGDSRLDLRIPVQHVQQAIARFTKLGSILSQHIAVADLQGRVDSIDTRLAAERKVIAELEAKASRTPGEQARLDAARRNARRLSRNRSSVVSEASYATVSLKLTSRKTAAQSTQPGRFDRFWSDAGDILGKEAIAVLYALVVAGPFALLALLALVGERARRRRADHRLLEETG